MTDLDRLRRSWPAALLALLAYVPALRSAPGRMPADSKLYLYLDPGGFLRDAASSYDPGQFAGWVPHQHISYLWPAGPWFWTFEEMGVPDWVAHRLWIGSIMLAAGLGVRWCARLLGLGTAAALTAAIVYQVSLYVLPYVSRTSVMLLPWAGLGWIVGFTIRAAARRGWADPAAIALIVFTVGAVNATALAMIVPAPVLWLVHQAWSRTVPWRQAVLVAARVAALSVAASLWWIAALLIQGRYGADVLPYSESLADVSRTATSAEVWRGLGYWLFYVRDPYAATTTESFRYLVSTPAIVVSFLLPVVCLVGLVWVRWAHRRFAALLVVAGGVLAVGVHPIDDRNPLMRVLAGGDEGIALALRSSTRALPVMMLGLALSAGALVSSLRVSGRARRIRPDVLSAGAIGALVLVNLPGLWSSALIDPALERDQDPPRAWREAADALVQIADGRVIMLPGAEFGAFRWGYTVDQPLPGLTDTPVVTRDLLPLGSPAAMDLFYAFDDRFQNGVAEPGAIAPIARLFAADTVWLANDQAFDRFRTPRPEVVRDVVLSSQAVGSVESFGAPGLNVPDVPMADERSLGDPRVGAPLAPVELAEIAVDAPLARAYEQTILVAGSGDGLVDAAAAGLVPPGVGIRYTADDPASDDSTIAQLVTDSNRDRARQWRGSQDTTGYTEPSNPWDDLLGQGPGDARLAVFDSDSQSTRTVAEQRDGLWATASSYGEPFAYLPEHRPVMAVDGDPSTAWIVGEHGDPVGQTIRLTFPHGSLDGTTLWLHQAPGSGRRITSVTIANNRQMNAVPGEDQPVVTETVTLDDRSSSPAGQPVILDPFGTTGAVDITIASVGGGVAGTAGAVAGVGFSEIELSPGPGHTTEVVEPPAPTLNAPVDLPLGFLFTRERADPMDRWRSDPEPTLVRGISLELGRAFEPSYTVRIDPRATDDELAELFDWPVVASSRLTGSLRSSGVAAFDGDRSTAWISAFGDTSATLSVRDVAAPVASLTVTQPLQGVSTITELTLSSGDEVRTVALAPDAVGASTVAVDPPLPPGDLEISVTGATVATTIDRRFGDIVALPVAIGEMTFDGAPRVAPLGTTSTTFECVELAAIDDAPLTATVTVAGDDWLDGGALVSEPCGPGIELGAESHRLSGHDGVLQLDRIFLDDGVAEALAAGSTPPAVTERSSGRFGGRYDVEGCDAGCWFVFGEGFDDGWSASTAAGDLGRPVLLDGGFNGWWLPPGTDEVDVRWTPQRLQTLALIASLVAAIGCIAILRARRLDPPEIVTAPPPVWAWERTPNTLPTWAVVAAWTVPALLLAGPWWALIGLLGGLVASRCRGVPLAAMTTMVTVGVIGLAVAYVERRDSPFPGGGWPTTFEPLHVIGMFAFAALVTSVLTDGD